MKNSIKSASTLILTSLIFASGSAIAASGDNETYKNLTLEERLYLFDGFGAKWAMDVGSDGLWFVPKRPLPDTYSASVKIRNSAMENSLVIGSNVLGEEGNVGIGTDTPTAKLDVNGSMKSFFSGENTTADGLSSLATLSANNSASGKVSDAGFRLENAKEGFQWDFRTLETAQGFAATKLGTGGPEFRVDNTTSDYHNVKVSMGGVVIFENGQLQTPSSRTLKTHIKPLETQAAIEAFRKLQPVSYVYKAHKDHSVVGFIAEDIPELVATKTRSGIDPTEIVAVLTKVVQAQEKKIMRLETEQKEMQVLKKRLSTLESLLTNLALNTKKKEEKKLSAK